MKKTIMAEKQPAVAEPSHFPYGTRVQVIADPMAKYFGRASCLVGQIGTVVAYTKSWEQVGTTLVSSVRYHIAFVCLKPARCISSRKLKGSESSGFCKTLPARALQKSKESPTSELSSLNEMPLLTISQQKFLSDLLLKRDLIDPATEGYLKTLVFEYGGVPGLSQVEGAAILNILAQRDCANRRTPYIRRATTRPPQRRNSVIYSAIAA